MAIRIEDGLGTGKTVGVNAHNRLEANAVVRSGLNFASRSGDAFAVKASYTIQEDNTEEVMTFLRNDSPSKYLFLSSTSYALINPEDGYFARIGLYAGGVRASGGSERFILNMYRSSGKRSEITAYDNSTNDLVVAYTPSIHGPKIPLSTYSPNATSNSEGALIVGPGNTLVATITGYAGMQISSTTFYVEAPPRRI